MPQECPEAFKELSKFKLNGRGGPHGSPLLLRLNFGRQGARAPDQQAAPGGPQESPGAFQELSKFKLSSRMGPRGSPLLLRLN